MDFAQKKSLFMTIDNSLNLISKLKEINLRKKRERNFAFVHKVFALNFYSEASSIA